MPPPGLTIARIGEYAVPSSWVAAVAEFSSRIVLIDGPTLAELMIDHDVGVSVATTYSLKRIDSDFFDEGYTDA